jgi:hypothetical protein
MVRGFENSEWINPWCAKVKSCAWTLDEEDRPTARPISRIVGE